MDSSTSSSPSPTEPQQQLPIPTCYQFVEVLGKGTFGKVVKYVKLGTDQTVAIKIPNHQTPCQEASMLKFLMRHNMDDFNVVKFYGEFVVEHKVSLVFEILDISLQAYLLKLEDPMHLGEIKSVMQQMATAFSALKRLRVIHTDLKADNILMVDVIRQPLRVKLIDFGSAIFISQAKPGWALQTPSHRAPEIMLGLPYSEAIDIWSLGCVMAIMVLGFTLFPAKLEYEAVRFIRDLLGPPPDRLLDAGRKSNMYFKKTDDNQWLLRAPEEWGTTICTFDKRSYTFHSLDEVKAMIMEYDDETEADEMWECIDLVKAMLTWDESERITPDGILNHPFINVNYLNCNSRHSSCNEFLEIADAEPSTMKAKTSLGRSCSREKTNTTKIYRDNRNPHPINLDKINQKNQDGWIKKTFCCCCNEDNMVNV